MADYAGSEEPDQDSGDDTRHRDKSVRWSTVALSVGLSALTSAVVIGVGSAVLIANADRQVTVIQAEGAADSSSSTGVTSKKDQNSTTARRTSSAAASTTAGAASSGSGASSTSAKEPSRINGGGVPAPVDSATGNTAGNSSGTASGTTGGTQDSGADADSASSDATVPPQPSNAELKNQMETILAQGASDDVIAANLANPAGVRTIRDAGNQMRIFPIFQYEMVDPVAVNGDQMTATIKMSMIGLGEKPPTDLYYVARNGKWVLTDESVCLIGQQARVSCSV